MYISSPISFHVHILITDFLPIKGEGSILTDVIDTVESSIPTDVFDLVEGSNTRAQEEI
nr:hypothetical protein [Tanacetum cinerariifolium]